MVVLMTDVIAVIKNTPSIIMENKHKGVSCEPKSQCLYKSKK